MKKKLRSKAGLSKLTTYVMLPLLFCCLYTGFKVGNFYFCYYDLRNYVEIFIRENHRGKLDYVKDRIYKKTKELGIFVNPDKILVSKDKDFIYVKFSYREVFYVHVLDKDYDLKYFDFDVDMKQKLVL